MIYDSILETIGNTPLVKLNKLKEELNLNANIYIKLESFNPGGSVKDRAALNMLNGYIKRGEINKDTVIIEPTSGNTGIGLSMACSRLGLHFIVTMPESMSLERRLLIKAYGADLRLTDRALGMKGAIELAERLKAEIGNAIVVGQFENMDNPECHYLYTAPEIYKDLDGKIDYLFSGIGTGGTITGISKYLHEKNTNTKVIGIEPEASPVLNGGRPGAHKIQGIGAGFKPKALSLDYVSEVRCVSNDNAYSISRMLPRLEGILIGISSGAALYAAIEEAKRECNRDKNIVVIAPDNGERYLSTDLFKED